MAIVFDDIGSPDATPDAVVTITLVGANSTPVQGYVSASDYSVAGVLHPDVVAGRWEAELPANATINPAGTVWAIAVRLGRIAYIDHVTVPAGAGPFFVEDILTDPPSAIVPIPLQAHLVDAVDAHAASAVSFVAAGALVATNVQSALVELDADLTVEAVARAAADALRVLSTSVGQVGGPAGPLNAQGQIPPAQTGTTAFRPSAYGTVDTTGVADSSAAVLACIAAAAVSGGVVQLPTGTIRCNSQITIPNAGATPRKQASITVKGTGQLTNGLIGAGLTSGTILDLRYSGSGAKIFTAGRGTLVMEDLTLTDYGNSSTPFVLSTGTTFMPERVTVIGNPTKSGATCDQDAFVFGGDTFGLTDGSYDACYSGYGSSVKNCYFDRIRRGIYGRSAFNAFYAENNGWSINCGGDATVGAVEIDGTGSDGDLANNFVGQTIEMTGYAYGYKFKESRSNLIVGGGLYDAGAGVLAGIRLEGSASYTSVVGMAWGGIAPDKYVSDLPGTNLWTVHTLAGVTGTISFGGGNNRTLIQPALTAVDTDKLLTLRRCANDPVRPGVEVAAIRQEGRLELTGTTAAGVTIQNSAGSLALDHESLVKPSGNLSLYPGSTGGVLIARGVFKIPTYTTGARPAANAIGAGTMYYDTTVSKPVYSDGTTWRDAAGTAV